MNLYGIAQLAIYAVIFWKLGFIYGVLCIYATFKLLEAVLGYLFNFELVQGSDLVIYFEDPNNYCNCASAIIIDGKIDVDQLREKLVIPKIIKKYDNFTKTLVNYCGIFFWKKVPLSDETIQRAAKQVKVLPKELKNREDINEFLQDISAIQLPRDELQWEMYCGDYQDNKSVMVMKFHHAMMDGMGALLLFAGINDCLNKETIPQMRGLSLLNKTVLTLLSPFYFIYAGYLGSTVKSDDTAFRLHNGFTGKKILEYSKEYEYADLKKAYGKFEDTKFNAFFMGTVGLAIKKHSKQKGFKDCKSIGIAVPVSLRPPPLSLEDLRLDNMIGMAIVGFPLEENITDSIQNGKQACSPFFSPAIMWNSKILQLIMGYFPEFVGRGIASTVVEPCDVILSNIPGPKKQIKMMGHEVEDVLAFTPHSCGSGFAILGYTYNGKFKFAVFQDTSIEVDTKQFIQSVEEEIDIHIS